MKWLKRLLGIEEPRLCQDCHVRMAVYEHVYSRVERCAFCADAYERANPLPGQVMPRPNPALVAELQALREEQAMDWW